MPVQPLRQFIIWHIATRLQKSVGANRWTLSRIAHCVRLRRCCDASCLRVASRNPKSSSLESVTSQAAGATHRHPLATAVSCRRRLCRRRPCRQTGPCCCRRRLLGRPAVPRRRRGAAARRRPPLLLPAAAARPVRSACPARPAPPPAPILPKSSSAPKPAGVNQANCGSFRDDCTMCMSRSAQWEL